MKPSPGPSRISGRTRYSTNAATCSTTRCSGLSYEPLPRRNPSQIGSSSSTSWIAMGRLIFSIKDLGNINYFLGVRVLRNRPENRLILMQDAPTHRLLEAKHLEEAKPAKMSLATGSLVNAAPNEGESTTAYRPSYASLVGSTLYLMTQTRPDTAFANSVISRYSHNPSKQPLSGKQPIAIPSRHSQLRLGYGRQIRLSVARMGQQRLQDAGCQQRRQTKASSEYLDRFWLEGRQVYRQIHALIRHSTRRRW